MQPGGRQKGGGREETKVKVPCPEGRLVPAACPPGDNTALVQGPGSVVGPPEIPRCEGRGGSVDPGPRAPLRGPPLGRQRVLPVWHWRPVRFLGRDPSPCGPWRPGLTAPGQVLHRLGRHLASGVHRLFCHRGDGRAGAHVGLTAAARPVVPPPCALLGVSAEPQPRLAIAGEADREQRRRFSRRPHSWLRSVLTLAGSTQRRRLWRSPTRPMSG